MGWEVEENNKCEQAGAVRTKGSVGYGTWEKGRDMRALGIEVSGRQKEWGHLAGVALWATCG